jgi:hypothetical protein
MLGHSKQSEEYPYAHAQCSGIKAVLDNPAKFKRTSSVDNGGNFFPLSAGSGLGFHFGCDSFYTARARHDSYAKQKLQSSQDVSNNLSQCYQPMDNTLISQATRYAVFCQESVNILDGWFVKI